MRMKTIFVFIILILGLNNLVEANTRPFVTNVSPDISDVTVYSNGTYNFYFIPDDPESSSMYSIIYYNTNQSIYGATIITNMFAFPGTNNYGDWNTANVPMGDYYLIVRVTDSSNEYYTNHSSFRVHLTNTNTGAGGGGNTQPSISNITPMSPVTVYSGSTYQINYETYDADDPIVYSHLYYNTNQSILGSMLITMSNLSTNAITGIYDWNTSGVGPGQYYIIGVAEDFSNTRSTNYSVSMMTISNTNNIGAGGSSNTRPFVTNISPDISDVTVYSNNTYNFSFYTEDPESSSLYALVYYNTSQSMSGATIITSMNALTYTNSNNFWDTIDDPMGNYYLIVRVTDSSNEHYTNYSRYMVHLTNTNTGTGGSINTQPSISNISPLSPVTVASAGIYSINYQTYDAEDVQKYTHLYYNTTPSMSGATLIAMSNWSTNYLISTYSWNTVGVAPSQYYIVGVVQDLSNAKATNFSSSRVTISNTNTGTGGNALPFITNYNPVNSDVIAPGSVYPICFRIEDVESTNMLVKLYYDYDKDIAGATLISSNYYDVGIIYTNYWSTSNVITGNNYYILGSVTDSSNATATSYSPGIVLIWSDNAPPAVPLNLTLKAGNHRITLNWDANTESDFKQYYIYRKSCFQHCYKIIAVTTANTYCDTNVHNGRLYYYKLRAEDNNGNLSDYSKIVRGMPCKFYDGKKIILNDNKITPGDIQELYINVTSKRTRSENVTVSIYDVSMRLVKKIKMNNISNGQNLCTWNLKNTRKLKVPTGVYFIYVEGEDWKEYRKVFIIR